MAVQEKSGGSTAERTWTSDNGRVSQPSQLTPADQDALVKQIGIALMRAAPGEWQQIRTEYRAAGRYYELTTEVADEAGVASAWTASHDIAMLFAQLRAGMHSVAGGTWFNARYQIDRPSRYNLEFDREEPSWRTPPPLQAYRDELHFFPRSDDDVPEWLVRRLSGLRPEQPGRRFRIARIFDGRGPSGRPSVNRPPVAEEERDRLLDYLDRSPMILPERGHDIDRLSGDGGQHVPVAFHSDGVWIWPAAVNYYLRHYGLPPEPGLVDGARANEFRAPEIDEATANEAAANITGPRPSGPPGPPSGPATPEPDGAEPTQSAAMPRPPEPSGAAGPPMYGAAQPAGDQAGPGQPPAMPRHRPEPAPGADRAAARPDDADEVVALLRGKLAELGIPDSAYRIGTPEPDAWFLEQTEDGWQVGWYEDEFSAPMVFDDPGDAAAFLLGKLLLEESELADEPAGAPSGRHADPANGPIPDLARPPEPELDARPMPASVNDIEEQFGRGAHNGAGQHSDPGIQAAAASANVDLRAHGFDPGFDEDSTAPQDRLDGSPLDAAPVGAPPPGQDHGFNRDGFDQSRFDAHRFEQDDGRADGSMFESPQFDDRRPDESRYGGDGFDRNASERNGLGRNGSHEARDPARFAATGLGGGPSDPAERATALNTSTMVGATPVEAPVRSDGRDAREDSPPPAPGRGRPGGEQAAPAQWDIQPLAGEPPLTLFRGKQLVRLDPGTEIDRFGDERGNLTYDAGTPFEERSLVPEWVNRPYHVYEVTVPIEVLSGVAIPWFDQPGGGTAYLLPSSVDELLDSGELAEVDSDGRP